MANAQNAAIQAAQAGMQQRNSVWCKRRRGIYDLRILRTNLAKSQWSDCALWPVSRPHKNRSLASGLKVQLQFNQKCFAVTSRIIHERDCYWPNRINYELLGIDRRESLGCRNRFEQ